MATRKKTPKNRKTATRARSTKTVRRPKAASARLRKPKKAAGALKATAATARGFVRSVQLPPAPELRRGEPGEATKMVLDGSKTQAAVVGSDIISFVSGVTPERRQDIINSSMFAQLVAQKKVGSSEDPLAWYEAYFDALTRIGWVIQEKTFAEYHEESRDFSAHEAIGKVAAVLLGGAATALAVVQTTLESLRSMDSGSPWITLYDRKSRVGRTAHFQATLVSQEPDGQFLVALMAFSLVAKTTLTQVLFFRVRTNDATLRHCSGNVTINTKVLDAIRPTLDERLAAFALEFVNEVPLPPAP